MALLNVHHRTVLLRTPSISVQVFIVLGLGLLVFTATTLVGLLLFTGRGFAGLGH